VGYKPGRAGFRAGWRGGPAWGALGLDDPVGFDAAGSQRLPLDAGWTVMLLTQAWMSAGEAARESVGFGVEDAAGGGLVAAAEVAAGPVGCELVAAFVDAA
jgi:hypothetical protein